MSTIFIFVELKSYVVKTLTSFQYRIDGLETLTQTIHLNVEKIINNYMSVPEHCSTVSYEDNMSVIDIDSYFPIKYYEELRNFETIISNLDICRVLVTMCNILLYIKFLNLTTILENIAYEFILFKGNLRQQLIFC